MKNFDEQRRHNHVPVEERTFQIGGEIFVAKEDVHPSLLTEYDRLEKANMAETLEVIDAMILGMIEGADAATVAEDGFVVAREGEARARYRAVREQTANPITIETLGELSQWLVEMQTSRPTGRPSVSAPGPKPTEALSTGGSSSPVIPRASAA